MAVTTLGVAMNGVTGRMGYRQHLLRSVLAIRAQGGVELSDGSRVQIEPLLIGRDEAKLREIAERHGLTRWTTDLDGALADDDYALFFDAALTAVRHRNLTKAMNAGRHVYTEKPLANTLESALDLARTARDRGVKNGIVHDKLYLPGLRSLKRLIDGGFFGRILSVRGEFGYWVFEGDWQPAQRPSWNYRLASGGGIASDMFCHWDYVLENLFGAVKAVTAKVATHIPQRWDENGEAYEADADDAAYAIFELAGGIVRRSTRRGPSEFIGTSFSSSKSMAPWAARWPDCIAVSYSLERSRQCPDGIRTSLRPSATAGSGRRCPRMSPWTTASSCSGSSSYGT
jgi:predicted dehydrogenase